MVGPACLIAVCLSLAPLAAAGRANGCGLTPINLLLYRARYNTRKPVFFARLVIVSNDETLPIFPVLKAWWSFATKLTSPSRLAVSCPPPFPLPSSAAQARLHQQQQQQQQPAAVAAMAMHTTASPRPPLHPAPPPRAAAARFSWGARTLQTVLPMARVCSTLGQRVGPAAVCCR